MQVVTTALDAAGLLCKIVTSRDIGSSDVVEKLFAGTVLAVCVVMLLRLCLGARLRLRFDHAARAVARSPMMLVHRVRAARGAAEAIRRAQSPGEWDGNVYTPKSFRRPRKPH